MVCSLLRWVLWVPDGAGRGVKDWGVKGRNPSLLHSALVRVHCAFIIFALRGFYHLVFLLRHSSFAMLC